eukprot:UN0925
MTAREKVTSTHFVLVPRSAFPSWSKDLPLLPRASRKEVAVFFLGNDANRSWADPRLSSIATIRSHGFTSASWDTGFQASVTSWTTKQSPLGVLLNTKPRCSFSPKDLLKKVGMVTVAQNSSQCLMTTSIVVTLRQRARSCCASPLSPLMLTMNSPGLSCCAGSTPSLKFQTGPLTCTLCMWSMVPSCASKFIPQGSAASLLRVTLTSGGGPGG